MAEGLDLFTIAFGSEGLKQFEEELKSNEKQLDRYQKEVEALEEELDLLTRANAVSSDTFKETYKDLEEARKNVKKFQQAIDTMKGKSEYQIAALKKNFTSLIKTIGLLAVVGTTVRKSLQFYEQAEQLDFLAEKTGIAADKLQELGNASSRFGGNTESTATSIENIRTNKEAYTKAGIRIENDPSKTLENVARKMESLSNDRAKWDLADSLGIDEATTRMLIQGVEKYNAELKKGSKYKLYTKEDIQRMRDYRQIQQDIRMGLDRMGASIYKMLLPAITLVSKIVRKITDWMAEHEGAVKIIGVFVAVAAAIGGIVLAVNALSAAIALLEAHPVVLIIIAVIAAITALIAIINDLIVFVQGGHSLIGDILEDLGYDTELLRKDILNVIEDIKNWFATWLEGCRMMGEGFQKFINKITEAWDKLPDPMKKMLGAGLKASLLANPMTALPTAEVMVGQKFMERYKKDPNNAVPSGAQTAYYNTQSQNANTTNNSKNIANNRNNSIQVDNINIQTQASNPQEVAQQVEYVMVSLDNAQRA